MGLKEEKADAFTEGYGHVSTMQPDNTARA